jgi:hypothetical protein
MRLKIRCDRWKKKYFGFAWEVNTPLVSESTTFEHKVFPWAHPLSAEHLHLTMCDHLTMHNQSGCCYCAISIGNTQSPRGRWCTDKTELYCWATTPFPDAS